jgi:putative ABC transport system ATP-binding protein
MNRMQALIQLENADKSYYVGNLRIKILQSINLHVYSGQSLAIMGPSGAGKSTMLHVMGLLTPLDSGTIKFNGRDICHRDSRWDYCLRGNIGFVFQDAKLIPDLNILENVCVPLAHRGFWPSRQRKLAKEALSLVGLKDRLLHEPNQLSGGEMARVAIARALVLNPVILLADEPTGNLDSQTGTKIADLLLGMLSPERALVFVTHHEPFAKRADRIVLMKDGKIESTL